MNIKKDYLDALNNHNYNKIIQILIENLIDSFDYKSMNDLGIYLFDVNYDGINIKLNQKSCIKLSSILIKKSYYTHPDIFNAFAFQFLCLEKTNNYNEIVNMQSTAILLKNPFIINNIAYANYKLGVLDKALDLQKYAININTDNSNSILEYNLMLYELSNNYDIRSKYKYKKFLEMLIGDEFFDYEQAIILAIYFNDFEFVYNNIDFFNKTFYCSKDIKLLIEDYLSNRKIISSLELLKILSPKTYYENALYINNTGE